MSFLETVEKARAFLERNGRVSLRALQREYNLEDDALDELVEELVEIQRVAARDGRALAWAGGAPPAPTEAPAREREPRDYTPKHLADKILQSKSALEGERKQVTVLFADVKGSMELAEQVDPEEWHRILERFFQILAKGVHRYEGTINQYTGDGVMALFGAPIAHEDHAQRGCYAALRLSDELRRYADELRLRGLNFSVRMGLNSGDVVVGKIGDDLRMDYTAQGHTVGLAARMQQIAASDRIYLTQQTARLAEGFFALRDLGQLDVKGVREPLRVYELQGVGPLRTRLEVAARRGLVRFVGRHGELAQLRRAWGAAQTGHGQIAAVVGEAGVGKSRLVYEFKAPLERGCRVLEAFSVSHGKATAYLPLIELLKSYFGIELGDGERQRREKITGKVLTLDRTLEDALAYLFTLLGVASEETALLAQMDPQIRRQRTLEALKRVLLRETLDQPCVLIFEDLHWIDGETQAFLDLLSESVATARLLLLVDYRPEYTHGWGSKSTYTQLRLDPLGDEEARELLTALLGEETSPEREGLARLILEKTEGNPFFMEEVVQTLAEEGVLAGERGGYRLERSPGELHIPATVQGVLAARIDRLPAEEKDFLQTLAVIGKEFPLGLLRAVSEQGEEELHGRLSRLQAGEFIYEQPAFPEPEYTFKHALTQEVAYGSLLADRRGALHERTARALEEIYRDGLDEHYGELAHHYGRSQDVAKAVEYLALAGEQALWRSAYPEAIGQLERGVELLEMLPESRERSQHELSLQIALGEASMATQGYTVPEAERAFVRAQDLCRQVGEAPQVFRAWIGLYTLHLARADHERAGELVEDFFRLARETGDAEHLLWASMALGETAFWRGDLLQARMHLEEAIARYDLSETRGRGLLFLVGDPRVWALTNLGWALWQLGYPEQALARSQESIAVARELSHAFTEASALLYANFVHWSRGEYRAVLEGAEALIALSHERGFLEYVGIGTIQRSTALTEEGRLEEGIAGMQAILELMRAGGTVLGLPGTLAMLAGAHRKAGQIEEGLALLDEAQGLVAKTGEGAYEAEVHRVKAELLLARSPSDPTGAEASLREALGVARRQSGRSYELRAATSLARLWQQQGREQEARELLAPIYAWFTEGFDTRDLMDAKALLDELA
jgi:class 3 adenylate cyclase/predicted ATPase